MLGGVDDLVVMVRVVGGQGRGQDGDGGRCTGDVLLVLTRDHDGFAIATASDLQNTLD